MHAAKQQVPALSFEAACTLAADDMAAVDRLIEESLASDVALVSQVSKYIVASGGKRLRPLIVLLAARAFGYPGEHHVRVAAIIEFIHTATLLHDDVVDSSSRRRGQDSANTVFGNQASVLVGDYLLGQAFKMMVETKSLESLSILSDAAAVIAEGEVLQLAVSHDTTTTEDAYLQVIGAKTAALFSAAAENRAAVFAPITCR